MIDKIIQIAIAPATQNDLELCVGLSESGKTYKLNQITQEWELFANSPRAYDEMNDDSK